MPDITMCKGGDCGIKESCYRYKATPCEYRQAYFIEPPYTKKMDGTSCENYSIMYHVGKVCCEGGEVTAGCNHDRCTGVKDK